LQTGELDMMPQQNMLRYEFDPRASP
jgi:hypothetical protein